MNFRELDELRRLHGIKDDAEVRIGEQIESGPYLHGAIGSVYRIEKGVLVLCVDDEGIWTDETMPEAIWIKP